MLKFTEEFELDRGVSLQIDVKDVLHVERSEFQDLKVFDTVPFGTMLTLDGVIQLTEFDNYAYHEMITHVAMQAHKEAKRALIIGGGDGGVVHELLKYDNIEEIVLCELDPAVVRVCKEFFPEFAYVFTHPKVKVVNEDGAKFIKEKPNYYDVVIVDSSDPIGPAIVLFEPEFYQNCHKALSDDGILITQSESMFYHEKFIRELQAHSREIFPIAEYFYTMVPTYPSGTIGFSFCSKQYTKDENLDINETKKIKTRYYNHAIHTASFCLPQFIMEKK